MSHTWIVIVIVIIIFILTVLASLLVWWWLEANKKNTMVGSTTPQMRKVIYLDVMDWSKSLLVTIQAAIATGYNVIILAFVVPKNPNVGPDFVTDLAEAFSSNNYTSPAVRQQILDAIHQIPGGGKLLVSYGGSTYSPDPTDTTLGTRAGTFAKQNGFDGVDFDIEFKGYQDLNDARSWLAQISKDAKAAGAGIVSHASQVAYFNGGWTQQAGPTAGGYTDVEKMAGPTTIDWYNIQFYNQDASCYNDFISIFKKSCSYFTQTSIAEIAANGVPLQKLVLGLPAHPTDASVGYLSPDQVASILKQQQADPSVSNWSAGLMFWEGDLQQPVMNADWQPLLTSL